MRKAELDAPVTRRDALAFATKKDLESFATKKDFSRLAAAIVKLQTQVRAIEDRLPTRAYLEGLREFMRQARLNDHADRLKKLDPETRH
ncbi:MAG: hypothetical protein WC969_03060 [Elusimicrobiota bacterium]